MRLNADILYENINESFPAELMGSHTSELNICRPEFFLDSAEPMEANHLYILPGDQFPRHLKLKKGAVILCSGNMPLVQHYLDRCCLIRIKQKTDPLVVMNLVTSIFDRYSRWYERLLQIVETTADLTEMTEFTSNLFRNPIMVLDSEFRVVTRAGYEEDSKYIVPDEKGADKLSLTALNKFLSATDMKIDETDPIRLDIQGQSVLSYNLFDLSEYAGSLTLEYRSRPYRPGDEPLIRLFAHYLMFAMKQHSEYLSSEHSILRKTLRRVMDEMPVDVEDRRRIEKMDLPALWRCIVFEPSERLSKVPTSYVCDQLEVLFPVSIAFSYGSEIVIFMSADRLDSNTEARQSFVALLQKEFDASSLKIGISSPFSSLFDARLNYTQGCIALENGSIFDPDHSFYFFENYALEELIINAPGEQPLEMYYSDGLKRLFAHDAQSQTSYIETLRTYLNNNMNVTATAKALYIHRSTLLERLTRIKKELWDDLSDPDVQLRLRIILKALELRDAYFR